MSRTFAGVLVVLSLWVLAPSAEREQQSSSIPAALLPGADRDGGARLPPTLSATVDVNLLFIGFERDTYYDDPEAPIDPQSVYTDVLAEFYPATYDPIIITEHLVTDIDVSADHHLEYRFHPHFASSTLENRFFEHLRRIGRLGPQTLCQTLYNRQQNNAREISNDVLFVSGPAAERWLLHEVRSIPGLTADGYTLVFINWAGRPDFEFHSYTGEGVDPDTGRDSSADDYYHAGVAWGGSHGRLWLYDFSAGPECASGNYNVDTFESLGLFFAPDGNIDYRIPPIWDMRSSEGPEWLFNDVTTAIGYLAHFATQLLLTASPASDPLYSVPEPGGRRLLRMNYFDGDPGVASSEILKPEQVAKDVSSLQPHVPTRALLTDRTLVGDVLTTFFTYTWGFADVAYAPGCWEPLGHPIYQLYCYLQQRQAELAAPQEPGDAVVPLLLFNVTDETASREGPAPPIGNFHPDPITGKPSHIFAQSFPSSRTGPGTNGMTTLVNHEVGHYVGLYHEHEGWASELGYYMNPFFHKWVWTFDECKCTMGYIYESAGFGVFERDNSARNLAARAYAETQRLLESEPGWVRLAASVPLRLALWSFRQMDWHGSAKQALAAYELTLRQTGRTKVETMPTARRMERAGRRPYLIDGPERDLEDRIERQRSRARQSLGPIDPRLTTKRFDSTPGIARRATRNPALMQYFEAAGVVK